MFDECFESFLESEILAIHSTIENSTAALLTNPEYNHDGNISQLSSNENSQQSMLSSPVRMSPWTIKSVTATDETRQGRNEYHTQPSCFRQGYDRSKNYVHPCAFSIAAASPSIVVSEGLPVQMVRENQPMDEYREEHERANSSKSKKRKTMLNINKKNGNSVLGRNSSKMYVGDQKDKPLDGRLDMNPLGRMSMDHSSFLSYSSHYNPMVSALTQDIDSNLSNQRYDLSSPAHLNHETAKYVNNDATSPNPLFLFPTSASIHFQPNVESYGKIYGQSYGETTTPSLQQNHLNHVHPDYTNAYTMPFLQGRNYPISLAAFQEGISNNLSYYYGVNMTPASTGKADQDKSQISARTDESNENRNLPQNISGLKSSSESTIAANHPSNKPAKASKKVKSKAKKDQSASGSSDSIAKDSQKEENLYLTDWNPDASANDVTIQSSWRDLNKQTNLKCENIFCDIFEKRELEDIQGPSENSSEKLKELDCQELRDMLGLTNNRDAEDNDSILLNDSTDFPIESKKKERNKSSGNNTRKEKSITTVSVKFVKCYGMDKDQGNINSRTESIANQEKSITETNLEPSRTTPEKQLMDIQSIDISELSATPFDTTYRVDSAASEIGVHVRRVYEVLSILEVLSLVSHHIS